MKRLFITSIIFILGITYFQPATAQETLRDRIAKREAQRNKEAGIELTVRAQIKNEENSQKIGNAPWVREVYRFLDLNKEKNGPLYYPVVPFGNRINLFTMIFQRLAHGDITAYKWQLNGSDVFTEDQKIDFKTDVLETFDIPYTEENGRYIVEDFDIPNNEVQGYYIKEAWYFDENNSVFDIKTIGICPILFRQDDYGEGTTRYPMFWVLYDNIRPYASRIPIMTSNLNNVEDQTVNDFFVKHNFEGEIYKTTNMRNLTLAEMYPDTELRKKESAKIETQLIDIDKDLWVYNDSVAAKRADITNQKRKEVEKKIKKKSPSNMASGNNSATRSMRNRKRN